MAGNTAETHYSSGIIVDASEDGPYFLVIEYDSGKGKQIKFPGGTNIDRPGETPDETLHREVRKEVGLVFGRAPQEVYRRVLPPRKGEGAHTKFAFLINFPDCSGEMRTQPEREDGDGDYLSPPFWRTAKELLNPASCGLEDGDGLFFTHRPMLEAALDYLRKK